MSSKLSFGNVNWWRAELLLLSVDSRNRQGLSWDRDTPCCCPGQGGGKLQAGIAWKPLGRSGLVALGRDNLNPQGGA